MTIHILSVRPDGSAHCVHVSPSLGEHFFVGRVRRDSKATYLCCCLCDAVTSIPRSDANADHRDVQALIDAGKITPLVHPDNAPLDPLQAGKDDGVVGIPAVIPQTTEARRALRADLKAAHVDKRPTGTHFQIHKPEVVEVHRQDASGTTVVEVFDVDAAGRMVKRP